ncbi:Hypothetical predicted protein, partial [Paramuricea clavata]
EPEAEPSEENAVLQELRELKDLMKSIKVKQSQMEKTLVRITKLLDPKDFELAKSSHAANVTKICAKAYIQLGRFQKPNESKTEQLRQEFSNSPYGFTVQELLHAERFEKAKFTYWRAEERRRKTYVTAVGIHHCEKDEKFCLSFYKWSEDKYGARGPTQIDWDIILAEEQ